MATAEFEFSMTINGTALEVADILKIMKSYAEGKDGVYFSFVKVSGEAGDSTNIEEMSEEDILAFAGECAGEVKLEGLGPYGRYGVLNDVDIFRDMAEAAPGASFEAEITGSTTYTEQSMTCTLADRLLNISSSYCAPGDEADDYLIYVTEKLTCERFVELFGLDAEEFAEDSYNDLLIDVLFEEGVALTDVEYEQMKDELGCEELTEETFEAAMEQIAALDIESYEDYVSEGGDGESQLCYDPVAKAYVGRSAPVLKTNQAYDMNDMMREYLQKQGKPCSDEDLAALSLDEAYAIMAGIFGGGEDAADDEADADDGVEATVEVEIVLSRDDDDEADEDDDGDDTPAIEVEIVCADEDDEDDDTDADEEIEVEVIYANEAQEAEIDAPAPADAPAATEAPAPEQPAATKKRRGGALKWIGITLLVLLAAAAVYAALGRFFG